MTLVEHDQEPATGPRGVAALAGATAVALTLYAIGVLLPFYVNGLHRLPLREVSSGAYDLTTLWPQSPIPAFLVHLSALGAIVLTPVLLVAVPLVGAWAALRHRVVNAPRPARGIVAVLVLVSAVAVVALLAMFTADGQQLRAWIID